MDQILISCENVIINIYNLYDVVIVDFLCDILSLNVKMYLWLKLYTVPFFVSGQTCLFISTKFCTQVDIAQM